jgi:hypothetical protein
MTKIKRLTQEDKAVRETLHDGLTPLLYACAKGIVPMALVLIELHTNVNVTNSVPSHFYHV